MWLVEAVVLIVWALKCGATLSGNSTITYAERDTPEKCKRLKLKIWFFCFTVLGAGLVFGGKVGKYLFFDDYSFNLNSPGDYGYLLFLAGLAFIGLIWLAAELLQGINYLKIHTIAKRVFITQGAVGIGLTTLAISALGVSEQVNNGLWYVAGVGVFWSLLTVLGFAIGLDEADLERLRQSAGSDSSGS